MRSDGVRMRMLTVPMRRICMRRSAIVVSCFMMMRRFEVMMRRCVVVRCRLVMLGGCRVLVRVGHDCVLR